MRAASCSRWATSSGSESAGSSSSSRRKRTGSGTSRKSSSTEAAPIVSSIASRSASVSERYGRVTGLSGRGMPPPLRLVEELPVGLRIEQVADLPGVGEANPDEPAVAVRILVDRLRRVDDRLVDLDDFAGERRDQVGDRL